MAQALARAGSRLSGIIAVNAPFSWFQGAAKRHDDSKGGGGQPGPGGRKKGLPKELQRLRKLLHVGLEATAALWPPIALLYAWVEQAAHILGEHGPNNAAQTRRQLGGLLGAMVR